MSHLPSERILRLIAVLLVILATFQLLALRELMYLRGELAATQDTIASASGRPNR